MKCLLGCVEGSEDTSYLMTPKGHQLQLLHLPCLLDGSHPLLKPRQGRDDTLRVLAGAAGASARARIGERLRGGPGVLCGPKKSDALAERREPIAVKPCRRSRRGGVSQLLKRSTAGEPLPPH